MKACHVAYSYYPFDPRVRKEAETLARSGQEIHVIALSEEGDLPEERINGVTVHRLPWRISRGGRLRYAFQYAVFFLEACVKLTELHVRQRFRIIHIHSLPDFLVFAGIGARLSGARLVLDLHEAMPEMVAARFHLESGSPLVTATMAVEWVSTAYADRVIVVNESIKELLTARGVAECKLTVVMNSPDASPNPINRFELGRGHPRIVYAGGINPERDLETLVTASSSIQQGHPHDLILFGRGEDDYVAQLTELARSLGIGERFQVRGWILPDAVMKAISGSALGPVTYVRNPITELALPNKVFEYAAAGVPLVVADLPALRRVFDGAARFYAPGNPKDLARRMKETLEESKESSRLATNAGGVLRGCSWQTMQQRLLDLYASLEPGAAR